MQDSRFLSQYVLFWQQTRYRICEDEDGIGVLVLNEAIKLLPLYLSCLFKSPLLLVNPADCSSIEKCYPRGDERSFAAYVCTVRYRCCWQSIVSEYLLSSWDLWLLVPNSVQIRSKWWELGSGERWHCSEAYETLPDKLFIRWFSYLYDNRIERVWSLLWVLIGLDWCWL